MESFAVIVIFLVFVFFGNKEGISFPYLGEKDLPAGWEEEEVVVEEVGTYVEKNYGADIDGNRGVDMEFVNSVTFCGLSLVGATILKIYEDGGLVGDSIPEVEVPYGDFDKEWYSLSEEISKSCEKELVQLCKLFELDEGTRWAWEYDYFAGCFQRIVAKHGYRAGSITIEF